MELLSAIDIQLGNFPAVQVWKGNSLIWNRGLYWSGLGSDNNWSNNNNWSSLTSPVNFSPIQFAGTNRLSAFNDLPVDTTFQKITFGSSSGSFQLSGNRFIIGSGGFANNSLNAQTINNDIKLSTGTNTLSTSFGTMTFNGLLSGSGSISKTGNGIAKVSVERSIFTGSVTVSGGTLQFDNLVTNGGKDLAETAQYIYNLNGNGATLNIFTSIPSTPNRVLFRYRTVDFSSFGNQTFGLTGTLITNFSTYKTNGGPKNYISASPVPGSNYFNAQFTGITYNVADGTDDVDLEISAHITNQVITKNGAGKMSVVTPYTPQITGPLTISAGTFDIGGSCSMPVNFSVQTGDPINTIANNGTFSYSSSINSDCSNFAISGTGNLIKSGTSSLTLSSARCTYNGSTSITNGSIVTTKDTATATFTPTTLTVNFSTPPNVGDAFKFFPGSTVQTYASVSLIGAPGRTASYDSTTSTLSTIS
jgi:autotransporter-associated beta strand protein